jgi:hypothetical protein
MARFRGTVRGQRGEASRLGSTNYPPTVTLNGWECGVMVIAGPEDEVKQTADTFRVYMTGGSNGGHGSTLLGTVWQTKEGPRFVAANGGAK